MRRCTSRLLSLTAMQALQVPASKWTWSNAQNLFHLKRQHLLGLPKQSLNASQTAVADLALEEKKLRNCKNVLRVVDIDAALSKACGTQKTFQEVKAMTEMQLDAYQKKRMYYKLVKRDTEGFAWKLRRALRAEPAGLADEEEHRGVPVVNRQGEKVIDTLAWTLAAMSGFDDLPLQLTAGLDSRNKNIFERGHEFKLFGQRLPTKGDVFVVRNVRQTGAEKLMIVFEDKLETDLATGGHVVQIAAECLMMQYQNIVRHHQPAETVYCVRLFNRSISFFALKGTKSQIKKVCLGRPDRRSGGLKAIPLWHHNANPLTTEGLNLVDQVERLEALQVLAAIREDMKKIK